MVSGIVKTGIVAAVGVVVIVLSSTLGWILVPDIATSVYFHPEQFVLYECVYKIQGNVVDFIHAIPFD